MVSIRIPGRGDGSGRPPALIDVAVDTWVRHAVSGFFYMGVAILLVWFWKTLEFHALLMLPMALVYILGGVAYLNEASRSRPPRKRRRRPRRNLRY